MKVIKLDSNNTCLEHSCRYKELCAQYTKQKDKFTPVLRIDIDSNEILCKSTDSEPSNQKGYYTHLIF